MSEARNEERKVKREMWKFTPLAACSPPCFSTRQGNRMNAMRLPVKGEERREKGVPGLLFGLRLAKTLFVSAETLPTDVFTLPSSPFTLPAIASCDCPARYQRASAPPLMLSV